MSPRANRILKTIAGLLLALAILHALLLLISSRQVRNAYRALERDGRPMQAGQIIPPEVPDSENAALLFQAAVMRLKAEPATAQTNLFERLNDLSDLLLRNTIDATQRDELRQLFAREPAQASLQMIREGVERPACRYPLDYSKGPGILLPHLSDLRGLSRILCAQARLQAEAGEADKAWDTAILGLRLARANEKEPLLISQLVVAAQLRLATDTIRELALKSLPSEARQADIDDRLARFGDLNPMVMAMEGERLLLGEWVFARPASEFMSLAALFSESKSSDRLPYLLLRFSPVWNIDHAAYLRILHRYAQLADVPDTQTSQALDDAMLKTVPRYCILTRLLVPALGAAKARFIGTVAEARITRAGLAVLRFRQTKGTTPDSLDTVGAGGSLDPFTGKPLVFKVTGETAAIYSVGPDLKDDGGSLEKGFDEKPRDLVWRF